MEAEPKPKNLSLNDEGGPSDATSLLDHILGWGVDARATDIHFSPLEADTCTVRARVDGLLQDVFALDSAVYRKVISRLKVLAEIDITDRRRAQDGRIPWTLEDRRIDFRVSVIPTLHGESLVLRVLDRSRAQHSIENLGFDSKEARQFRSIVSYPSGLVLVTGPTGAGKTTTLYAALEELARPERNVMTLEDPIEYEIPRVLQTAVNPRLDQTFAGLLRSVLRHDPDVIMVGEVRDAETAQIAVRAALTGHLVLTSLHTQRTADAVSALLNFGVKPYALAPTLRGVISQQLVRKVCSRCRTTFEYGDDLPLDPDFAAVLPAGVKPSFSIGQGCDECFQTGYRERRAIFEILEVDENMRQAILRSPEAHEVEKVATESGMLSLRQKAFKAVLDGATTAEEVVRAIPIE